MICTFKHLKILDGNSKLKRKEMKIMNQRKRQKATWIDIENYKKIENEARQKGQKIVYLINSIFRERYKRKEKI